MTHKEMEQMAVLLQSLALPELRHYHNQYPAQMSSALWLLEMLPSVLGDAFHEMACIEALNSEATKGRAMMADRFGILDSYDFTSATAHLGEMRV